MKINMDSIKNYPLHMYGHKLKLLNEIFALIPDNTSTFLDVFGGTGLVGRVAKSLGCTVLVNDIMRFAHLRHKVLIANNNVLLSEKDLATLCEPNPNKKDDTRRDFVQHFGEDNSIWLDNYISNVPKLDDPTKIDIAIFLPVVSVLLNSHFDAYHFTPLGTLTGNQHYHDLNLKEEVLEYSRTILPTLVMDNGKKNIAYHEDAVELVKKVQADVCYGDPSYVVRAGDYQDCLAFLDDLVQLVSGNAEAIVDPYDNKADLQDHTEFFKRKDALMGFWKFFRNAQHIPLILVSYNTTSGIAIAEIISIAKSFGREVSVTTIKDYPRPTTIADFNTTTNEVIISCKNPGLKGGGK